MSNPIQQATEPSPGPYQKWFGVYPGVVVETRDDRPGWVKVQLQWALPDNFGGKKASGIILWARLGSPYAGSGTGVFFLPEIGDEIIVAFCGGEPSRAYVLGAVWSNASPNPGSGNADTKVIQTRSGNEIAFQDTDGDSGISIQTQNGTSVVLKDAGGGSIKITTDSGTSIHIDAGGITPGHRKQGGTQRLGPGDQLRNPHGQCRHVPLQGSGPLRHASGQLCRGFLLHPRGWGISGNYLLAFKQDKEILAF
jgi:uncharacterized protein involved in type VI secretion and phage assembly